MNKYKNKNHKNKDSLIEKYNVNENIRANRLFVIDSNGNKLGEMSKDEALRIAEEEGLDLVQVGGGQEGKTVVAKIMDFGKFLYIKKKQMNEAKKHQKVIQVKEIKMRPNIGDQDYKTKLRQAVNFLKSGKKVKFTLQFRGREMIVKDELGSKMFERITNDLMDNEVGNLVEEKEQKSGAFWTKIYFVK